MLYVLVEGGTEDRFVKALLGPHLGYNKTTHGPQVTTKLGIEGLKQRCPRFSAWVGRLEALGGQTS